MRSSIVASLLLPAPAAAQQPAFFEALRDLAGTMVTSGRDASRAKAAIDRMETSLAGWDRPIPLSAVPGLVGDEAVGIPALPLGAYADGFEQLLHGDYRHAIQSLRRGASVTMDERSRLAAAGSLSRAGRNAEAARALHSIIAEFPRSGIAHWWLARVYENLNRASDARREYESSAAVARSGRAQLDAAIGRVARAEGNFARAIEAYEHWARLTPKDPAAHKYLAWILNEQDRPDEAAAEYEAALRLDPKDGEAYTGLGRIRLAGAGSRGGADARGRAAARSERCSLRPGTRPRTDRTIGSGRPPDGTLRTRRARRRR